MDCLTKNRASAVINRSRIIEFTRRRCPIPRRDRLCRPTVHCELNLRFTARFGHIGNRDLYSNSHTLKRNDSDTLELDFLIDRTTLDPIRLPDKLDWWLRLSEILTIDKKNASEQLTARTKWRNIHLTPVSYTHLTLPTSDL